MKITCVNYFLILLVNFPFKLLDADNSTLRPPVENYPDHSMVLSRPIDGTRPTVFKFENLDNSISLNSKNLTDLQINNQNKQNKQYEFEKVKDDWKELSYKDNKNNLNQLSSEKQKINNLFLKRPRRFFSAATVIPHATNSLNKNLVNGNKNQLNTNADLLANMIENDNRSTVFDDQSESKSDDPFIEDKYLPHLSAYDRVKIKNDKFQYDNFFGLYDYVPENILDDHEENKLQSTSKNPYDKENEQKNPFQHLIQYRPIKILSKYEQKPKEYITEQNLPFIYTPHTFSPSSESTIHKFKNYQKQRIENLLDRPVSEMFKGKFKPDFEPKYMLEAPQRSHQQTGLGELFIVLGPLVILPLLSSFALTTFTTLYVTKSLITRPSSIATGRQKQLAEKLMKDDNQTLFRIGHSGDGLVYNSLNVSNTNIGLNKASKNKRSTKSNGENKKFRDENFSEYQEKKNDRLNEFKNERKKSKDLTMKNILNLKNIKSLKRLKRNFHHHLGLKELSLSNDGEISNLNKSKKKIHQLGNDAFRTKSNGYFQTPWLPITRKFTRQPRNSFHNKLYIMKPIKKIYKKISKEFKQIDHQHINLTKNYLIKDNYNFDHPSNPKKFAIDDAIVKPMPIKKFKSEFMTENLNLEKNFGKTNYQSAPSYDRINLNFSATIDSNSNEFSNFSDHTHRLTIQPKIYNLKIDNSTPKNSFELIKRNLLNNKFGDEPLEINNSTFEKIHKLKSFDLLNSESLSNDTIFQSMKILNPFDAISSLPMKQNNTRSSSPNKASTEKARKIILVNGNQNQDVLNANFIDNFDVKNDFSMFHLKQNDRYGAIKSNSDLDVIQKYLNQTRPDSEYNDEIIATYLACNGLLNQNNQCLQRLVCHYVDTNVKMPELEKEVASLIIYAILKNKYIDDQVKQNMRKTAQIAYRQKHGQCSQYQCLGMRPHV